jgi:hypothetical protein
MVKVLGSVDVRSAELRGAVTVGGRWTSDTLLADGAIRAESDLIVRREGSTKGSLWVGGSLTTGSFAASGQTEVRGAVHADHRFEWRGDLTVGADLSAEAVVFDGRLVAEGVVEALAFSGQLRALSKVREIRAGWIEVKLGPTFPPFPLPFLPPPPWRTLGVDRIEATEAHLSGVRAFRVKADRIWLGPESHVQYAEGTIVEQHKTAHLGPESEWPPPPGLTW